MSLFEKAAFSIAAQQLAVVVFICLGWVNQTGTHSWSLGERESQKFQAKCRKSGLMTLENKKSEINGPHISPLYPSRTTLANKNRRKGRTKYL